jgi:hypothetical protein
VSIIALLPCPDIPETGFVLAGAFWGSFKVELKSHKLDDCFPAENSLFIFGLKIE